ncbi:MAG: hemolysin family protein [Ignavibacteria bacterium]|nr:hemolysin family protein [Ignavibacteria bacterium]
MDPLSIFLKIAVVLFLVVLNGFFVAAEFAIVKVRATQIEPLIASGIKRAKIAQHVVAHLDAYLSACQLGITLASLGLGWVGEPLVARLIEPVLTGIGITQPALIGTISFTIAFSIITFLHIVLGELAPKSLAIRQPQAVTLRTAGLLHVFFIMFKPFIDGLNKAAIYFMKLAGIPDVSEAELAHSEEELRILLSDGKMISSTGRGILLRAMELRNRSVREVMVPRTEVTFLSTDKTIEENVRTALDHQFTRYPLCKENLDHVIGMIHLKDLFRLRNETGEGSRLPGIKREILFVPETMPLERVLNLFLQKRVLMAIAVDEYGGTAGLVTLENVLEELVGEIRDEFDSEPLMVHKLSDDEFVVDGTMPLHDFARTFNIKPESRDVVTVSGFVTHILGRVPERGAVFEAGGWKGSVEEVEEKKVKSLRLHKHPRTKEGPITPESGKTSGK